MEFYDARLESFTKGKRVKSKNTTTLLKWPHEDTYMATPALLAEAGFYYEPSLAHRDNVKCFMCKKELDAWDQDDDPLIVHFSHCRNKCAWAVARCGNAEDLDENGSFTFTDSTRAPTSKTMEKARTDTFALGWPHDAAQRHGANSKMMAKAGFLYAPHVPGDDTAVCVYCTVSLSGWDEDDDPLEEHRKRVGKTGRRCAFFDMLERPQPSRSTTKTASKSSSQSLPKKRVADYTEVDVREEIFSEDDLLPVTQPNRPKRSTSTRASTLPAKTPASRKSTRSGGTNSRARGTAASETEEDMEASGTDTGKRVSKSKRKGAAKSKEKIEAIEEEEEAENIAVDEEPVVPKPKRGRPPGKTKAAAKAKKASVAVDVLPDDDEVDILPPRKSAPARARQKAGTDSESEAVFVPKLAASQSKPKSASRSKKATPSADLVHDDGDNRSSLAGGAERHPRVAPPVKSKLKGKTVTAVKSKAKAIEIESDDELLEPLPEEPELNLRQTTLSTPDKKAAKNRKSSSTSDDAGYATAEQPMEVDQNMDMQLEPQFAPKEEPLVDTRRPKHSVATSHKRGSAIESSSKVSSHPIVRDSGLARSVDQASSHPSSKPSSQESNKQQKRISSRPQGSLARPPSRLVTEIVDISSDDADELDILHDITAEHGTTRPAAVRTGDVRKDGKPGSNRPSNSSKPASSSNTAPAKHREDPTVMGQPAPKHASPATAPDSHLALVGSKAAATTSTGQGKPFRPKHHLPIDTSDVVMAEEDVFNRIKVNPAFTYQTHTESILKSMERVPSPTTPPPDTSYIAPSEITVHAYAPAPVPAPLPSFDEEFELEKAKDHSQVDAVLESFTPFLSLLPMDKLTSLTEDEADLTLEQYIRQELERQYLQFEQDGQRRIAQFKQRAAEARRMIEDL